ncbi:unnamed protein product [Acanthoscelides obtectus]|nr:unnamed protein product [Acanthoscelides obtectus]CAK1649199.1 Protein suppressor of white apricot [Acanthoscelides obtectus]
MGLYQQGLASNPGQFIPPADFQSLDPNIQAYIQHVTYNQYMQQFQQQASNNSYAQIVSNVNKDNPYAANVPQIPQSVQQKQPEKEPVAEKPKQAMKKSLHCLAAAYGSDSESEDDDDDKENDENEETYSHPTGEMQVIIDKMALYVSKNGEQFEEIVKAKADPRFNFLNDGHEFNKYYREKIKEMKGGNAEKSAKKDDSDEKEKKEESEKRVVKKEKKVIAPVCFSIKKSKDDTPKEIKSALPVEDSDEEEENAAPTPPVVPAPASLVASLKQIAENKKIERQTFLEAKSTETRKYEKSGTTESKQSELRVEKPATKHSDLKQTNEKERDVVDQNQKLDVKTTTKGEENGSNGLDNEKTVRSRSGSKEMSPIKNGVLDGDDPILELIELTGEDIEDNSNNTAEGKLKNKLAAAKERLNAVSRLQLERKRKAAAFLKLKSTALPQQTPSEKQGSPLRGSSADVIDDTVKINRVEKQESDSGTSRSKSKSPLKMEMEARISISDDSEVERERRREKRKHKLRERSRTRDRDKVKKKKRERRKKSHKRKHSKSKHDKSKKKLMKSHRMSNSVENSCSSESS